MEMLEDNASKENISFDDEEKKPEEQVTVAEQKNLLVFTENNETFELETTDSVETPIQPTEEVHYERVEPYEKKEDTGSDGYGDQFVQLGSYEGMNYGPPAFFVEDDGDLSISYGIVSDGAFIGPRF